MLEILEIKAIRVREEFLGNFPPGKRHFLWRGSFITKRTDNFRPTVSTDGLTLKKLLKKQFPLSKNNISVRRSKNYRNKFIFRINLKDETEEARFIMTIKNFEGLEV